jgi:aminoglycoside phosphotransferase (APT) family kinase protein
LVHVDYWSGNILWVGDRISAVVDWEEAGYGDPAVDVAYCVMELALEGFDVAVADFIDEYVRTSGRRVDNLGYWKLAAAVRPMLDIDARITTPAMARRFDRFIEQALRETS